MLLLLRTAAVPDGPAIATIAMALAVRRVVMVQRGRQVDVALAQRAIGLSLGTRDVQSELAQRGIAFSVN